MASLAGVRQRLKILVSALVAPSEKLPVPIEDSTYYDSVRISGVESSLPVANANLFAVLGPGFSAGPSVRGDNSALKRFAFLCRQEGSNKDSCEADVGRLLYGIVRSLRAKVAIEVGVYKGAASCHIAQGLMDNGGDYDYHLVDISQENLDATKVHLRQFSLERFTTFHRADGARLAADGGLPKADFVFLDADHSMKAIGNDIRGFWPLLNETGLLVLHDSVLWNGVRARVNCLARSLPECVITLATSGGSGVSIVRKGSRDCPALD